jgi:hypothetical protein
MKEEKLKEKFDLVLQQLILEINAFPPQPPVLKRTCTRFYCVCWEYGIKKKCLYF